MAQQTINVGASPNDGTGTPLRTAFQYTNSNFSELYTAVGPSGNNIVVPGNATITGDLTVDTSTLKVDSANNRVGIGTASPSYILDILGASPRLHIRDNGTGSSLLDIENGAGTFYVGRENSTGSGGLSGVPYAGILYLQGAYPIICGTNFTERYRIASDGVATWSNVGGVAGTAMTLNSTGLGVGASPSSRLDVANSGTPVVFSMTLTGAQRWQQIIDTTAGNWTLRDQTGSIDALIVQAGSGNVGIGVTPSAKLDVSANDGTMAIFRSSGGSSNDKRLTISSGGAKVVFNISDNSNTATARAYEFQTAGSAAMTLDASGNLLVGTTTTNWGTDTGIYGFASGALNITRNGGECSTMNRLTSDGQILRFYRSNALVGAVSVTTTGTTYDTSSDYRLKESVQPLSGGLARVNALKPSVYKWKIDGSTGEGFIAHELAEVVPLAVNGQKDAVNEDGSIKAQGIDMSRVVPILVAAIQELTARVQTLETR